MTSSSNSNHSIRIGGISDLKIDYGFSLEVPEAKNLTTTRPVNGSHNYLAIFLSNPQLVKCLTNVTFIPSRNRDSFQEKVVSFETNAGYMFLTDLVSVPSQPFKLRVKGYDIGGNLIERIITSPIEAIPAGK